MNTSASTSTCIVHLRAQQDALLDAQTLGTADKRKATVLAADVSIEGSTAKDITKAIRESLKRTAVL